jgi:hypothetical protein
MADYSYSPGIGSFHPVRFFFWFFYHFLLLSIVIDVYCF